MNDKSDLEFTGERFTPECVREIAYEHWHRYAWAAQLVGGKDVLDAACGEGYGSHLLRAKATAVTGIDLSEDAIAHARKRYGNNGLSFDCGDCTRLPYEDNAFDVVVSFETLEHLEPQDQLLAEFRRVLRSDGFLILSSPDKKTYTDDSGYDNPYHVRELYREELEALLSRHFPVWRLWGQKLMFVSALWELEGDCGARWLTEDAGRIEATKQPLHPPLYFLAIAAAETDSLPDLASLSLYSDRAESVYSHYNEEVAKHIRAGQLLAEREMEIETLRRRLEVPWWRRLFRQR